MTCLRKRLLGIGALAFACVLANTPVNAQRNEDRNEDFHVAIRKEDLPRVTALLAAGAAKDWKDRNGWTALIVAVDRASANTAAPRDKIVEILKLLLDAGANTEVVEELNGYTALTLSASRPHADVVKLLLDAGANKNAPDHHDRYNAASDAPLQINYGTPLIHAAARGHADVVKLLLDAGANKDATDHWGNTALSAAQHNHHDAVAKLLLNAAVKK